MTVFDESKNTYEQMKLTILIEVEQKEKVERKRLSRKELALIENFIAVDARLQRDYEIVQEPRLNRLANEFTLSTSSMQFHPEQLEANLLPDRMIPTNNPVSILLSKTSVSNSKRFYIANIQADNLIINKVLGPTVSSRAFLFIGILLFYCTFGDAFMIHRNLWMQKKFHSAQFTRRDLAPKLVQKVPGSMRFFEEVRQYSLSLPKDDKYGYIITSPEKALSIPYIDRQFLDAGKEAIDTELMVPPCPRGKGLLLLVRGSGGGKTRYLEELRKEYSLEKDSLCLAITFNSFWCYMKAAELRIEDNDSLSFALSVISRCYYLVPED